ncbi:hypothetical protein ACI2K4_06680 [Micromonospora sp. NPDC050397]|uniref:hypothetical protein n=1 Tax=Micromonospora sp. NPDC050397 TaxID=3364279 RepID=UPI00384C7826
MTGKATQPAILGQPFLVSRLTQAARLVGPLVLKGLGPMVVNALRREPEAHRETDASRTPTASGYVLLISGDVGVEHLQRAWDDAGPRWTGERVCQLDLSDCRFGDVASLVYLIARLLERERHGPRQTSVRLPTATEALNFLWQFNFHNALTEALDRPLSEILTPDSVVRLALTKRSGPPTSTGTRPTLPANQFPVEALLIGSSTRHVQAVQYAHRWLSRHVLSALNRDLAGAGSQVARAVVLEALMAASTSSGRRRALVAAYYGLGPAARPCLQIVIWWDEATRSTDPPAGERGVRPVPPIRPAIPVDPLKADATKMLALATEQRGVTAPDLRGAPPWQPLASPPTVFADAVTQRFAGRLDVYHSVLRMILEPPKSPSGTDVTPAVSRVNWSRTTRFPGNLLVVTIPFAGQPGSGRTEDAERAEPWFGHDRR